MRMFGVSLILLLWATAIPLTDSLQQSGTTCDRRDFLWGTTTATTTATATAAAAAAAGCCVARPLPAVSFEGGVGGLGKTKPETGVTLRDGSSPIQNQQGIVSAEIMSSRNNPLVIQFKTPWPLLPTTTGLEARDLQQSESAFIHVISDVPAGTKTNTKALTKLLTENILGSKGKYGAYGAPVDIKFKKIPETPLLTVTFTTYTPAMRETERKLLLYPKLLDEDSTLVVLVVSTTLARFKSQEQTLQKVANSFVAIEAPKSNLR